jgi:hypothetical protein
MSESISPPEERRHARLLLAATLAALVLWGAWFIDRTSFVVDGERYFALFDDAMISMTYARNLVEGHGLNWAREGEPVEGFTTPLWTFLMIGANLGDLPLGVRPALVQALSLLLLALHVVLVHRLVRKHFASGPWSTAAPATILTAFYYPLNFWGLVGMETALQAVLTTSSVHLAFEIERGEARRVPALFVVLSLAYLTRMDMALLAAVVVGYLVARGAVRRSDARRWAVGVVVLGLAIAGYQTFRWFCFHDLLPNTYYLKLTGIPLEVRFLRGVTTYVAFARENAWLLLPVLLGAVPLLRRRAELRLPLALFAAYSVYSVFVGGDAWEMHNNVRANRFVVFVMPQLFVVANALVNEVLNAARRRRGEGRQRRPIGRSYLLLVATVVLWLVANGLWLSAKADENWRAVTVQDRPLLLTSHVVVFRELRKLQEVLAPGARVATFWAGIPAYYSDYRIVDMFGYSDRVIARREAARPLHPDDIAAYTPGHVKWDYGYVFTRRPPDAFLQAWHLPRTERAMAARGYRQVNGFWVRDGTPWLRPEFR